MERNLQPKRIDGCPVFSDSTQAKLLSSGWQILYLRDRRLAEFRAAGAEIALTGRGVDRLVTTIRSRIGAVAVDRRRLIGFDLWTDPKDIREQISQELEQLGITDAKLVEGNALDYLEINHELRPDGDIFKAGSVLTSDLLTSDLLGGIVRVVVGRSSSGVTEIRGVPQPELNLSQVSYHPLLVPCHGPFSPPWVNQDGSINVPFAMMCGQ